jgi:hypothetical protein
VAILGPGPAIERPFPQAYSRPDRVRFLVDSMLEFANMSMDDLAKGMVAIADRSLAKDKDKEKKKEQEKQKEAHRQVAFRHIKERLENPAGDLAKDPKESLWEMDEEERNEEERKSIFKMEEKKKKKKEEKEEEEDEEEGQKDPWALALLAAEEKDETDEEKEKEKQEEKKKKKKLKTK